MCKDTTRAIRRFHRARIMKNRQNYWGYGKHGWRSYCEHGTVNMNETRSGQVINTPTPCSCSMCGNQRKNTWEGAYMCLTIQERSALDNYNDYMEEIDDLS